MREHTHTRNRVRKKAHFFRMFSMIAFIISWMALEPLGGQFLLANSYSLFWLFVHFVSYILMGFTVYLQAKALSYAPNDTNMHYCRYRRTNLFTSTLDNFRFICSSSGLIQMDRAAFAYIILCSCCCTGNGGSKRRSRPNSVFVTQS